MGTFRLGKKPAIYDSRTLRFGAYLTPQLPPPPDSVNYGQAVANWPMYYNDRYGDCTCAAAAHMIQNWTANAGNEVVPVDTDVLSFYEYFTTPGPENGCNMLEVLKYWASNGLGSDQITAFAQLEQNNVTEVMDAVNLFSSCYIGIQLPDFAVNTPDMLNIPWVVPPGGAVGDAAPDPANGHCVPAVAYDRRNLYVVTWGAVKSMSWPFYQAYCDESYAVLSTDFLTNGQAPAGFNLAQLQADLGIISNVPAQWATIASSSAKAGGRGR